MALKLEEPEDVAIIDGFTEMSEDALQNMISEYGLAMTLADIKLIQKQYKKCRKTQSNDYQKFAYSIHIGLTIAAILHL